MKNLILAYIFILYSQVFSFVFKTLESNKKFDPIILSNFECLQNTGMKFKK